MIKIGQLAALLLLSAPALIVVAQAETAAPLKPWEAFYNVSAKPWEVFIPPTAAYWNKTKTTPPAPPVVPNEVPNEVPQEVAIAAPPEDAAVATPTHKHNTSKAHVAPPPIVPDVVPNVVPNEVPQEVPIAGPDDAVEPVEGPPNNAVRPVKGPPHDAVRPVKGPPNNAKVAKGPPHNAVRPVKGPPHDAVRPVKGPPHDAVVIHHKKKHEEKKKKHHGKEKGGKHDKGKKHHEKKKKHGKYEAVTMLGLSAVSNKTKSHKAKSFYNVSAKPWEQFYNVSAKPWEKFIPDNSTIESFKSFNATTTPWTFWVHFGKSFKSFWKKPSASSETGDGTTTARISMMEEPMVDDDSEGFNFQFTSFLVIAGALVVIPLWMHEKRRHYRIIGDIPESEHVALLTV